MKTSAFIKRHRNNPVLSAKNVPYNDALVFNAGVTKFKGRYVMIFRNDFGSLKDKKLTGVVCLGIAFSDDGIEWNVEKERLIKDTDSLLYRAYDPRLTVLDDKLYMCFALGDKCGTRGGVAVTEDLENWKVLSLSTPDNRNMVIFPERINGKIYRLERPFASYLRPGDRFDIFISASHDGVYWGDTDILLSASDVSWVNEKIGPAAPPIKTEKGWLTLFHGVDTDVSRKWGWFENWNKRYSAGIMLLDLNDPRKIKGICREPVLVPEPQYGYEAEGYRDYVVFPGGMILENDGMVKIYYGAADTVECLAETHVDDLIALCR